MQRPSLGIECVVLAVATAAAAVTGLTLAPAWIVPVLAAAPAWLAMAGSLRRGSRARAIGMVLWWAACLAITVICFTAWAPARAERAVLNGAPYRDEMLMWISTGEGRESSPSLFIPQHLAHAAFFCLLTLVTGGLLSLVMGAALMGYMSFYVGDLIQRCAGSHDQMVAILVAWNPWSIVRVVSFVILGVVLSEPLMSRFPGRWPDPAGRRRLVLMALAGLGLDLLLKAILAPLWPPLLRGCLD